MEPKVCCGQAMVKELGQIATPHVSCFCIRNKPLEYIWKKTLSSFWVCYVCGETVTP